MIRLVAPVDVPRLVPLGELFFGEARQGGKWNPAHFMKAWVDGISGGYFFCLVQEEAGKIIAAFGGVITPCTNTGELIAAETFYYALPEARGRAIGLFKAFEEEAKRRGAKRVWMIHLEHLNGERMAKWYQRKGYSLKERLYMKEL
jgi:GNAT superfamily N-acetyltransferase